MRRVKREELRTLSIFLAEQLYEIEPFKSMMTGIYPQKAKLLIAEKFYGQFAHPFYRNVDVFVNGDDISGVIIGMNCKKQSLLYYMPVFISVLKIAFVLCTNQERKRIIQNMKPIKAVLGAKWFKKFCKEAPYYLAVFAIDKASRGTGLCRVMIEYFFEYAKTISTSIVLETHTKGNVPMYEHFGFELAEAKETADGTITEYRMIRKLLG